MDSRQWKSLTKRFLIPRLPGEWVMNRSECGRTPNPYLAWLINYSQTKGGGFEIVFGVKPLFHSYDCRVRNAWSGVRREEGTDPTDMTVYRREKWWDPEYRQAMIADPEQFFVPIVDRIVAEAVPFFNAYGSDVSGYLRLAETVLARLSYPHWDIDSEAAEACILLGDVPGAYRHYQRAATVVDEFLLDNDNESVRVLARRAVQIAADGQDALAERAPQLRDELIATTVRMREFWGLLEPESDGPPG